MIHILDAEMGGLRTGSHLEVGHGDDAFPEPFVFGLGIGLADLETEDATHGGDAPDGEAAVAGEFVVWCSGLVISICLHMIYESVWWMLTLELRPSRIQASR